MQNLVDPSTATATQRRKLTSLQRARNKHGCGMTSSVENQGTVTCTVVLEMCKEELLII
jgi:hypothetical protein